MASQKAQYLRCAASHRNFPYSMQGFIPRDLRRLDLDLRKETELS
jgi:hypothetical protein